ncbi:MAG: DUF2868 domain-containing protein [Caldimonas sp.]
MNEHSAREVLLLQAFESVQPASPHWGDDDRAWATRLALQDMRAGEPARPLPDGRRAAASDGDRAVSGPAGQKAGNEHGRSVEGGVEAFIVRRAAHAMQRLGPRVPAIAKWLGRRLWRPRWIAWTALIGLVLGAIADSIGDSQRINLLALPTWGVVLWNAVVYLVMLGHALVSVSTRRSHSGALTRLVERAMRVGRDLTGRESRAAVQTPDAQVLRTFAGAWTRHGARLSTARAATLLHVGAATLALGLVAGLYVRGLVLDYRAGWESTFLDASTAHAVLATLLAPAAALSGIGLPDGAAFEALRRSHGSAEAGASAAPWIHLIAITLILFVVLPRGVLAAWIGLRAQWLARRMAVPLTEPYFQRLARQAAGDVPSVVVVPYASAPGPSVAPALRSMLASACGDGVRVAFEPTVAYSDEDEAAAKADLPPATTLALALFDLSATPEIETHGRHARRLAARAPAGAAAAVLVDETGFRRRFAGDANRLAQRREAWRTFAEAIGTLPVFVDFDAPDPVAFERSLELALRSAVAGVAT